MVFALVLTSFMPDNTMLNDDNIRMFFIARSKNANLVCYDLNIDKNGKVNSEEPLKVYWINKTDHMGERSDLNYFQKKMAYGYNSKMTGKGIFEISLVAFQARKVILERDQKGKYRGRIVINGKPAALSKIFVQAKPENSMKVSWVELTGIGLEDGKIVTERIIPD
ncbi:MAG: hypothetical protein A2X11_12365 [Bacteroidetes bacterium GWE2_42_24]|nr:MAG: hypothetical protein A2X11_12365 [Bacteroidetes bacterium GWE2_42_24]OFY30572.1 MAG: hypothetical protein A2X09_03610 [Bacteroidetes bacterium GWF2_43_11]